MDCNDNKDLILFAIDQHLTDKDKRIVPVELLNIQRLTEHETVLQDIKNIIKTLDAKLQDHGYHLWISNEYVEKDTED